MKLVALAVAATAFSLFTYQATVFAQQGVGIGIPNPLEKLDVSGAIRIGTDYNNTNAAPSGGAGTIRFRAGQFEGWDGTAWVPLSGGAGVAPFEVNSNVVRSNAALVDLATDDFVFGSTSLDDNSNTDNDTRMLFDKSKGAFRAGTATGSQWNDANRGLNSFGLGTNVQASGDASFAWGDQATASGNVSIAFGQQVTASGDLSYASGYNTSATGFGSVAIGFSASATGDGAFAIGNAVNASGNGALVIGENNDATAIKAFAIGSRLDATGERSIAIGSRSTSSGYHAITIGRELVASGNKSFAFGEYNASPSAFETVFGRFSETYTPVSTTVWEPTDRLFSIGNGTYDNSRSNALTILKNGNTGIGTSSPTATLHVDGTLRVVDGNQAAGKVLTSDGTGNATWQTLPAGSDDQNLTGATLTGTTLQIDIEGGSSASVNLASLVNDADADATNEIQDLTLSGNTLSLSGDATTVDLSGFVSTDDQNLTGATLTGTTLQIDIEGGSSTSVNLASLVNDADASTTNELQTLSQTGLNVTLSNGGGTISVADNDNDASNEIQDLTLSGNTLSLSGDATTVDLSGFVSTDDQNLTGATLTGTTLQIDIEGGSSTSVNLASLVNDADASTTNELQTLSQTGLNVTLSNGGGTISVADNDNDASNELQTLSVSGANVTLSNGGGTVTVNDGDWTINGNNQYSSVSGNVGIGTTTPTQKLDVAGSIRMVDGNQQVGYIPVSDANGKMTWTDPNTLGYGSDWKIAGNAGTDPANDFIGTTDNQAFVIRTNNTRRLKVHEDGFVEVGNNDQTFLPGITNNVRFMVRDHNGLLSNIAQYCTGAGYPVYNFINHRGTYTSPTATQTNDPLGEIVAKLYNGASVEQAAKIRFGTDGSIVGDAPGKISLYTTPSGSTTPVERMTIKNDGNVGVGTHVPSEKLHVAGSIRMVDGNQQTGYIPVSDANGKMIWTNPTTITTANDGDWTINGNNQYSSVSGNVGIGTTSPSAKLEVTSDIKVNGASVGVGPGGSGNTRLGATSLTVNTGNQNTAIGRGALRFNTSGNFNTTVGGDASENNTTGSDNTVVGRAAFGSNQTGSMNTVIGKEAGRYGSSRSGNVYLGYQAGYSASGDNKLYIENSSSNSPLIYGEFDNDIVGINGNLGVGTQSPAEELHVEGSIRMVDGNQQAGFIAVSDANGTMTWTDPSSSVIYGKDASAASFATGSGWQNMANTGSFSVTAGDIIQFTGQASVRLTGGSGADEFEFKVRYYGCAAGDANVISYLPTEDATNHNNVMPIPYNDVITAPCTGTIGFLLQVRNLGDDGWEAQDRVLVAKRY